MQLKDINILFVEDDEFIGGVIVHHLQEFGAKHEWVRNGLDAIELLKINNFDIVLTDLKMEGGSGVEMIKQMRSNSDMAEMPILVLTNLSNDDPEVARARQLGVSGFFAKSSTPFESLAGIISCILKEKESSKEICDIN